MDQCISKNNNNKWKRSGYIRAHVLRKLKPLGQRLGVERRRLGAQGGERRLLSALHGRLDHAVQTAQDTVHVQLRAPCDGRDEPTRWQSRGAGLTDAPQNVAGPSVQTVQQGLAEGGGTLLRRGGTLEGERRTAAGRTIRVELLDQKHKTDC